MHLYQIRAAFQGEGQESHTQLPQRVAWLASVRYSLFCYCLLLSLSLSVEVVVTQLPPRFGFDDSTLSVWVPLATLNIAYTTRETRFALLFGVWKFCFSYFRAYPWNFKEQLMGLNI